MDTATAPPVRVWAGGVAQTATLRRLIAMAFLQLITPMCAADMEIALLKMDVTATTFTADCNALFTPSQCVMVSLGAATMYAVAMGRALPMTHANAARFTRVSIAKSL